MVCASLMQAERTCGSLAPLLLPIVGGAVCKSALRGVRPIPFFGSPAFLRGIVGSALTLQPLSEAWLSIGGIVRLVQVRGAAKGKSKEGK